MNTQNVDFLMIRIMYWVHFMFEENISCYVVRKIYIENLFILLKTYFGTFFSDRQTVELDSFLDIHILLLRLWKFK